MAALEPFDCDYKLVIGDRALKGRRNGWEQTHGQLLCKILVHAIRSTKHRQRLITPEFEGVLQAYKIGIFRDLEPHRLR